MPKTLNDYLSAWNSFFGWLVDNGHAFENPFQNVKRIPVRGRVSFRRRALTDEEITELLQLPERRALYLTALSTGLRRGELSKLQAADFIFDGPSPYIRLRAEITKNGKESIMYLHQDLLPELGFVRQLKPSASVFPLLHPRVFRRDCKRAGIKTEIAGRRVDFHALRYTFCTRLARSGISPQVAKELMRHSDMRLTTGVYTDTGLLGVEKVLTLPSLVNPPQNPPQKQPKTAPKTFKFSPVDVMMKLAEVLDIEAETMVETFSELVEVRGVEPLTS
ncbi:MAG: tyrosine-type recombinase/integrase [Kiritimatiellales bacterium]